MQTDQPLTPSLPLFLFRKKLPGYLVHCSLFSRKKGEDPGNEVVIETQLCLATALR